MGINDSLNCLFSVEVYSCVCFDACYCDPFRHWPFIADITNIDMMFAYSCWDVVGINIKTMRLI